MTHHHTTLGFEIEFTRRSRNGGQVSIDDVIANVREAGIEKDKPALANISDQRRRYNTTFYADRWVQAYDCSCGWEIKSQPLTDTSEVEEVMRGLRLAGAQVDRSCGLHVHVGIAHLTVDQIRRLCKLYARYEPALDLLLPRSRRGSRSNYARSNFSTSRTQPGNVGDPLSMHFANLDVASDVPSLRSVAQPGGRFSKMNLQSYESKTTVEFRGHTGTLNFQKIDSWASLLASMVKLAEGTSRITATVASFAEMLDELIGTQQQAEAARARRPRAGTKAAAVWAAMDDLFAERDSRFFRPSATAPAGFRLIHNQARALLLVSLGLAPGTTHVAITRWAQAQGMTPRPSDSRTGLRTFLTNRAEGLEARAHRSRR